MALPTSAFAAVEITHIEYDVEGADEGREWIEVTNKGQESVDVSKFKFLEGGVNHKLTVAEGSAVLAAGASAIIASDPTTYLLEHAGEARTVFKSSFSLSNTGESLALINAAGKVEYSTTYTAAPKPKPAPKASTKSPTSAKTKTSKTSASEPRELVYTDPKDLAAVAGTAELPPMLVWWAGLGGIIALGTAGAVWARVQKRANNGEVTPRPGSEFEIVES